MKDWNPFKILNFSFDRDNWFSSCDVPKKLAICPCCDGKLTVNCDAWEESDDGKFMLPESINLYCENTFDDEMCPANAPANRMPYVYWLPLETKVEAWLNRMLEIYYGVRPIPKKWLEKNSQLKLPFDLK